MPTPTIASAAIANDPNSHDWKRRGRTESANSSSSVPDVGRSYQGIGGRDRLCGSQR